MASPYFQSLNLAKQDHSAIGRSGEVVGRMYAQMGEAIAKVGSAYFERKGMEKKAQEMVKTPHGQQMLISGGMSKEEVTEMSEDPKKANKMMYDIINDSGGIKEFNDKMQDFQKTQMLTDQFNQQKDLTALTIEQKQLTLNALEKKTADEAGIKKIFGSAFKQGEDGVTTFDHNNLSYTQEEAHLLPQVFEQLKSLNLMPEASHASWLSSAKAQGIYDRTNPSLMRELFAQYMSAFGGDIKGEARNGMYRRLEEDLIEPTVVMETSKKYFQSDPNYKERQMAESVNDKLQAGIQTAIKQNNEGAYEIANASSAGFVVRQFARLANGVGVMTDQDVNSVKGASDARSTYERLKTQILGDGSVERKATAQDVQNGWADKVGEIITVKIGARASVQDILGIQEATKALMEVNDRRLEQMGIETHEKLKTAYPNVSEERLLELSPYSKYHNRAYAFTMSDDELPDLAKTLEVEGEEFVATELKKANPNLKDDQIAELINKANNFSTDQKISGGFTPTGNGMGYDYATGEYVPVGLIGLRQGQNGEPKVNPTTDTPSTSSLDPNAVVPASQETVEKSEAMLNLTGTSVVTVAGGGVANWLLGKTVGTDNHLVSGGLTGLKGRQYSKGQTELLKKAEKLLPHRIKDYMRNNPKFASQVTDPRRMAKASKELLIKYYRKAGVGQNDILKVALSSKDEVQEKLKYAIKSQIKDNWMKKFNSSRFNKLLRMITPDTLFKKAIPFVGTALLVGDVKDIATLFEGNPEKIEEAKLAQEKKFMKAGIGLEELIYATEAMEELLFDENNRFFSVDSIGRQIRQMTKSKSPTERAKEYWGTLGKAESISKPKPRVHWSDHYFKGTGN